MVKPQPTDFATLLHYNDHLLIGQGGASSVHSIYNDNGGTYGAATTATWATTDHAATPGNLLSFTDAQHPTVKASGLYWVGVWFRLSSSAAHHASLELDFDYLGDNVTRHLVTTMDYFPHLSVDGIWYLTPSMGLQVILGQDTGGNITPTANALYIQQISAF